MYTFRLSITSILSPCALAQGGIKEPTPAGQDRRDHLLVRERSRETHSLRLRSCARAHKISQKNIRDCMKKPRKRWYSHEPLHYGGISRISVSSSTQRWPQPDYPPNISRSRNHNRCTSCPRPPVAVARCYSPENRTRREEIPQSQSLNPP